MDVEVDMKKQGDGDVLNIGGEDVGMMIGMMERGKEREMRYVRMMNIIDEKVGEGLSSEVSEIE
ncbi:hypothetical protein [Paenibacillus xylanexedens]|uniref:hypothetical protein n=1 Tax=Paenibacillus xylanexedens TaxID=528191 RepID=UPI00119CEDB2|nr:hypothetical protein [Paenibacillus xylanexedens]